MFPQDSGVVGSRPRESSNSFANGSHQNMGNHITSTPTTRVLKPPGGGSSICLGGGGSSDLTGRVSTSGKARVPPARSNSESSISFGLDNGCDSYKQKLERMRSQARNTMQ